MKKGHTNNPNGRPKGAKTIYTEQIKTVLANHFIESKDGANSELENILHELKMSTENKLSLKDKISASYDYFRIIAPQARDTGEIEQETQIKSALFNKFFNKQE